MTYTQSEKDFAETCRVIHEQLVQEGAIKALKTEALEWTQGQYERPGLDRYAAVIMLLHAAADCLLRDYINRETDDELKRMMAYTMLIKEFPGLAEQKLKDAMGPVLDEMK